MFFQQRSCLVIAAFDQPADFRIDLLCGFIGHCRRLAHTIAQIAVLPLFILQRAKLVRHAPLRHHVAGKAGRILDVARCAAAHLVVAEHQFLGDAAAHADSKVGVHLVAVIAVIIAFGQAHHHAQCAAARNDGGLVDRVRCRFMNGNDGMACLMKGGHALFVFGHHHRLALGAHHHLVFGVFKFLHRNETFRTAGRKQSSLVHQIGKISTRKAGSAARDHARIDVGRQWYLFHVDCQDLDAAIDIGARHDDLAVKTARAQQSRVKNVRAVCRSDDDDTFIRLETVHFDQQLVQRLFAFVILVAKSRTAAAADRIDFVDEDDARRVLLGLFEHVAHAACADANKHFDKVRT